MNNMGFERAGNYCRTNNAISMNIQLFTAGLQVPWEASELAFWLGFKFDNVVFSLLDCLA